MRLNYIDCIDCLEGLAEVPDNSVDLIVTDCDKCCYGYLYE